MRTKFVWYSIARRGSSRPAVGRIFSWTAKTYWSVRPRTKIGIETPRSEMTVTIPSPRLWTWRAA